MDDIVEKLMLLDYESKFCKPQKRKPLSWVFFSCPEDEKSNKPEYLYELCYWIMSIGNQKRIGAYLNFKNFKTPKEAMAKLLSEAKKIGVKT